jgi:hypothetical protein
MKTAALARRPGIPILLCNIDMAGISRIADSLLLLEHIVRTVTGAE